MSLRVGMVHLSDFRLDSRVQRQARALAERGDEVHLVCLGEREELRVGAGSIHVHPVAANKTRGGASAYVRGYASFLARAAGRLTALDLRRRFDLVETHNMPDLIVATALVPRLRGTPVVLDVHDTFPELFATKFGRPDGGLLMRLMRAEERACAAVASHVVAVTEQARRRLEGRGVGVGRTTVVMNSPDERVFGAPRAPVAWPETGPLRILYHGGLAPRFGVEAVIRAVGLLGGGPDVRLRVCGSGEDRDHLAALAAQVAPGRIDVAPEPVPFERIPAELEQAHIGVVPTLHDSFTELLLPVKLLEYVHMGLPVVASRLPCISDYFPSGALKLFTAGDPADLAHALAELCADPAGAREHATRATRWLEEITWERQRAGYLALIDELVRAPRFGDTLGQFHYRLAIEQPRVDLAGRGEPQALDAGPQRRRARTVPERMHRLHQGRALDGPGDDVLMAEGRRQAREHRGEAPVDGVVVLGELGRGGVAVLRQVREAQPVGVGGADDVRGLDHGRDGRGVADVDRVVGQQRAAQLENEADDPQIAAGVGVEQRMQRARQQPAQRGRLEGGDREIEAFLGAVHAYAGHAHAAVHLARAIGRRWGGASVPVLPARVEHESFDARAEAHLDTRFAGTPDRGEHEPFVAPAGDRAHPLAPAAAPRAR